ncbi:MAG: sporulation/spore germination protein, partial [Oscillatoriales cyanobacterium]
IDLRRDPNAARPWIGLSTCEQFALFGGLRETIMNAPDGNIDRVEFLSLGEPLTF